MPGLNCGKCGRKNCAKFALDISKGRTNVNECPFSIGSKNYIRIRQFVKRERKVHFDQVAVVKCKGGIDCQEKFIYNGDKSCASKNLLHSGDKACPYACLGCGDCVKACVYGAITISDKGCAVVDPYKCVGCGECVSVCPNNVLRPSTKIENLMQPEMSYEKGYCRPECTKCSKVCPTGAISVNEINPQDAGIVNSTPSVVNFMKTHPSVFKNPKLEALRDKITFYLNKFFPYPFSFI